MKQDRRWMKLLLAFLFPLFPEYELLYHDKRQDRYKWHIYILPSKGNLTQSGWKQRWIWFPLCSLQEDSQLQDDTVATCNVCLDTWWMYLLKTHSLWCSAHIFTTCLCWDFHWASSLSSETLKRNKILCFDINMQKWRVSTQQGAEAVTFSHTGMSHLCHFYSVLIKVHLNSCLL